MKGALMNGITLSYQYSGVSPEQISQKYAQLVPTIEHMHRERARGYETSYASLSAPFDTGALDRIKECIARKKTYEPTMLVVIGIGGSNLGTMAVLQSVFGLFLNDQQPDIKVYFADTIDSDYCNDILLLINQELEQGGTVMLNVISKSGATTETNLNFQLFAQALKSFYESSYKQYIVVTSDAGSRYEVLAHEQGYDFLPIPKLVGGRYSVFTAVGLFPLGLLGIDIDELVHGAVDCIEAMAHAPSESNPAIQAALTHVWYEWGIAIDSQFIFSTDLHALGLWYRQLVAESLGKQTLVTGQSKEVGIVPIISMGTVDLHSMVQLYLAGPNTMFTTFISVDAPKNELILASDELGQAINGELSSLSFVSGMKAILQGTCAAYKLQQRPFCLITLADKSEYTIGQFLQWNMLKIMYLGALLQVDPFDQPQVELYKKQTRRILTDE